MDIAKAWIDKLRSGLSTVLFPNVCLGCENRVLEQGQHICSFCLRKRFEIALTKHRPSSADIMLPQAVTLQQALWKFDRGGVLQHLLHHLKYQQLKGAGIQLGSILAQRIQTHPNVQSILTNSETVLIPIPLHYLRFRKRGFNQAFCIAKGIQNILNIPICSIETVTRIRNTVSQTGLTLEKRQENVKNAFCVKNENEISGKVAIIVDDVFTTGATSFELSNNIAAANASSIMIWTIAQA